MRAAALAVLCALLLSLFAGSAVGFSRSAKPAVGNSSAKLGEAPDAGVNPSPTAADIDGDGRTEILCGAGNALVCRNGDGSQRWAADTGARVVSSAACADVNGCGKMEIFVGNDAGWLYGFAYDGRPLSEWGWPKATFAGSQASERGCFSSPAIGDIDRDGTMEIVVGSWSSRAPSSPASLST
jgi:hypothetical protein